MRGKFITFEGTDGLGKTTNIKLLADFLRSQGREVLLTREPGGTEIAEVIRKVMLQSYAEEMSLDTEVLLSYAARMQHLERVIQPALNKGVWVISDRFFDSAYAYQGARGLSLAKIQALNDLFLASFTPDCTLLFDAPIEVGLARISKEKRDRFEEKGLLQKVRDIYLSLAKHSSRMHIVDATQDLATISATVINVVNKSCS